MLNSCSSMLYSVGTWAPQICHGLSIRQVDGSSFPGSQNSAMIIGVVEPLTGDIHRYTTTLSGDDRSGEAKQKGVYKRC
ncbi:hypothetical protein Pla22_11450 [Rubripirellula amarantea]|uniref:Uncharacterized protein n=1 Tax=Rubripirellula amarantea TaxID=2527999 RepID=A0A5C5WRS5_9BACT|nr:hypothetical protein Pla22_11450 [Rubripirellula amarantea]